MALSLVTAPTGEPISVDEAKLQVRRTEVSTDDQYIEDVLIPAVRERAEQATLRQLLTATWDYKLDAFPCSSLEPLVLPKAPLQSVTSVSYVDENGTTQVWSASNYAVDAPTGPKAARGRILPAYGVSWPSTRTVMNAVIVRFVSGYGADALSVPPRLKLGMLLDLGTLFEHREDVIVGQGFTIDTFPLGSPAIYQSFRSW